MIEEKKICAKCGIEKSKYLFCRDCNKKDGRSFWCKDCNRETGRAFRDAMKTDESFKARHRKTQYRWAAANVHKTKAHRLVRTALENGRLTREPCKICGTKESNAHHSDYTKPLDILWLCESHHKAWHRVFIPEVG